MRNLRIASLVIIMTGAAAGCSSVPLETLIERYDGPTRTVGVSMGSADIRMTQPLPPEDLESDNYLAADELHRLSSIEPGWLTQ